MAVLKNIPIILFSIIICSNALAVEPGTKPDVQVKGEGEALSKVQPEGTDSIPDSVSKEIEAIFEKADKLQNHRKNAIRQSLDALSNEELVREYARPEYSDMPSRRIDRMRKKALEQVEKDRQGLIEEVTQRKLQHHSQQYREQIYEFAGKLAELGVPAVPAICIWMGELSYKTNRYTLAHRALMRMGPEAVEPLIRLMDKSQDSTLRKNIAYVLRKKADPRVKEAFLRALHDEREGVRIQALLGLKKLGPEVVGQQKFVQVLLDAMDDEYDAVRTGAILGLVELGPEVVGYGKLTTILINSIEDCPLINSIQALARFGDEKAIEPLRIIERFHPRIRGFGPSKGSGSIYSYRYEARLAINAILQRAGKPAEDVSREHYKVDYKHHEDELRAAAQCPNPAIRESAKGFLVYFGYEAESRQEDISEQVEEEKTSVNLARAPAENTGTEAQDFISKQIAEIFEKADKLQERNKQRYREYLSSLSNEELAILYARATTPQPQRRPPPSGMNGLYKRALEAVKNNRHGIINKLVKRGGGTLGKGGEETFRNQYAELADELAGLGAKAVPILTRNVGGIDFASGHRYGGLAKEALLKMGSSALKSLIKLMSSKDKMVRAGCANILSKLGDPRAKDVLLRTLDDEADNVRKHAFDGLVRLGPDVVGHDKLVTILIEHLKKRNMWKAIRGLKRFGDERAIEPLCVIEQFHPARDKADQRFHARLAMNAILRRVGKPVKEASSQDYTQKPPTYEQLCAAARCPNAAIRQLAIKGLARYGHTQESIESMLDVKEQNVNEEIKNLLSKVEKLENEHLKVRMDKWNAMSKEEKQKIMGTNMAISSGLEKDLNTLVRETASQIAAFGVPAVPILLEELAVLHSEIHYPRRCIARSLRQIGRLAVPYLIEAFQAGGPGDKVALGRYKYIIISTLGEVRDTRAVEPLLDLFRKNRTGSIRWTAAIATALGLIGDKRAVGPLISELDRSLADAHSSGDWDAQGFDMRAYTEALGRLGDKRAIPTLKRALDAGPQTTKASKTYLVAEQAAQALRSLGADVTENKQRGG